MNADLFTILAQMGPLACALTDEALQVVDLYDPGGLIAPDLATAVGQPLPGLVPELLGSEPSLHALAAGQPGAIDLDLVNRSAGNGDMRYLRILVMSRQALGTGSGGVTCLLHDISEYGATQQQLMQSRNELLLLKQTLDNRNSELYAANQKLRQVADARSSFVSIAAHELKTPLAVILGYADLLLDESIGSLAVPQRESLATLRQSAARLLQTVSNLLDLARLEAGRLELVMQPLDLAAIVRASAREFQPLFLNAHQALQVSIAPDLPAALCDEARVFQILSNLLGNASKYTQAGGQISLSVTVAEDPGEMLVAVQDNGVGIPLDEQDQLGQLYFRASTSNQIDAHGVGLGLYITRSLVQLHGGRLWFESAPGLGSTFYVTFLVASPAEW